MAYPKQLIHPLHSPAVIHKAPPIGCTRELLSEETQQAKAERFPAVVVSSERQEGLHRAQGYMEPHEITLIGADVVEYPKWVGDVIVNSREEEEALSPASSQAAVLTIPPAQIEEAARRRRGPRKRAGALS